MSKLVDSERNFRQQTADKLVSTFARVHGVSEESAREAFDQEPYLGAAIDYDDLVGVKPPKYLEKVIGRFYGRDDIRIRFVEVGRVFSTIVVGVAAAIDDQTEVVLYPDQIAHFKEEVLYDSALHLNQENGQVCMNSYKSADVVRLGKKAPFSTHVRKLPLQVMKGLSGILSRTDPEFIDI